MDKDEKRRKSENDDLIRRMRMGESLVRVDVFDTWFPPRPTIKKDKEAIRKLYACSHSHDTHAGTDASKGGGSE